MMEYMDGGSLQDIADNGGVSDESVLANIAVQVLAGLDFLHKCNQIHRGNAIRMCPRMVNSRMFRRYQTCEFVNKYAGGREGIRPGHIETN